MKVQVKLFATLREGRFKAEDWELPDGMTVNEVLARLKINPQEVSILLVNGRDAAYDRALSDGDTLALFPPVGGG